MNKKMSLKISLLAVVLFAIFLSKITYAADITCTCPSTGNLYTFKSIKAGDTCDSLCAAKVSPKPDVVHNDSGVETSEAASSATSLTASPVASSSISFENPISSNDVASLLAKILSTVRSLIIVLATVFIVIGGIMYMVSAGNSGMMDRARKILTAAIIGLVIALSADTFLVEIWNILRPADIAKPVGLTLSQIAVNVLKLLVSLVWVLGIISMVVGGMFMLTAYGNEERAKKGKTILTYAILGVVISLSALIIVGQIQQLIGG